MLIAADSSLTTLDSRIPIGLTVMRWSINDNSNIMILVPFQTQTVKYVEAHIITEDNSFELIAPATPNWGPLTEIGFGNKPEGYPLNERTAQDLYDVWDDGALRHTEQAEALYITYSTLIDHFTPAANVYIQKLAEQAVAKAKFVGWDPNLVMESVPKFPY